MNIDNIKNRFAMIEYMARNSKNHRFNMDDLFIYTEIVRCGEIGIIALRSFYAFHPKIKVHVFGLESDRPAVKEFPEVTFHSLDKPDPKLESWGKKNLFYRAKMVRRCRQIAKGFDEAHLGTASLWAHLIETRPEKYLLHFDSDVIFRAPALSDITSRLSKGYDLVGPPRAYKHNPNSRDDVRHLRDLTQTCFFGFNKNKIDKHPHDELINMCRGYFSPLGTPIIDFFDPVEFEILHNGGKIYYLSIDDYGGCNLEGNRINKYPKLNAIIDFGDKFSHFSAVGSGLNFYENADQINEDVPDIYINYALEKYAVYVKLFYDRDIDVKYNLKKYAPLFKVKNWY